MSLNAKTVKSTGGGNNQALVPVGMFPARVAQVLDLGLQARKAWKGKDKPPVIQLWVTYELVTEFMKDEDGNAILDKPRWISEKMNLFSLDQENATSTKRIKGIDPTGELDGDWGRAVAMPCLVQVVHSKDGKYANIGGVSPEMNGMVTPALINDAKTFDMDAPDMEVFNALPDFLQGMMKENLEFKGGALEAAIGGAPAPAPQEQAPDEDEEEVPPY